MVRMTSFRFSRAANSILNTFVGLRKKFLKNIIFARGKWSPHLLDFRGVIPSKIFIFQKISKHPNHARISIIWGFGYKWRIEMGFWTWQPRILEQFFEMPENDKIWKSQKWWFCDHPFLPYDCPLVLKLDVHLYLAHIYSLLQSDSKKLLSRPIFETTQNLNFWLQKVLTHEK